MRTFILLTLVAATAGQRIRADHLQALEAAKASGARIPAWAIAKARRNQQRAQAAARAASDAKLATPRRHLPHVTASYTLTPQGKMRIGKRNNAVLRKYYDVVAMEKAVVALRPKPLAASANASWEEDLAAARRDPC